MTKPPVLTKIRALNPTGKIGDTIPAIIDCLNGIADEIEGLETEEAEPAAAAAPEPTPDQLKIAALEAELAALKKSAA